MDNNIENAKNQAQAQLESITEMVKILIDAQAAENEEGIESARKIINDDPLSVEIRSDWHSPGAKDEGGGEYTILLCTGGPACRIIGDLSEYNEPKTARIEYQNWFTPWTPYLLNNDEEKTVLIYAQQFYYGE